MSQSNSSTLDSTDWDTFLNLLHRRRAIRDFADRPVEASDLEAIVKSAGLSPSSLGMQPYELHVVVDSEVKKRMAEACNGQRAAKSAAVLVAVVVSPNINRRRIEEAVRHYRDNPELPQKAREYHLNGIRKLSMAHHPFLLPFLGLGRLFISTLLPSLSLLPLGSQGLRDWAARNGMMAAQTLLLAASARGLDSCPMEGFDGAAVARVLGLPRQSAVAVVIGLGYRAENARIEKQWRRDEQTMIIKH